MESEGEHLQRRLATVSVANTVRISLFSFPMGGARVGSFCNRCGVISRPFRGEGLHCRPAIATRRPVTSQTSAENRRYPRIEAQNRHSLQVEWGGNIETAVVSDISESGIGFLMPQGTSVNTDDVMAVGIDQVINLRGRVRWVDTAPGESQPTRLGVEFESIIVQPKRGDETQEMVDAWMKISESYNTFDSFLQILDLIDNDVLDGKLTKFTDAVGGMTLWMENSIGALDLWHVIESDRGEPEVQVMVDLGHGSAKQYEQRRNWVVTVATSKVTRWFERRPYIYGQQVVIEYFGSYEGRIDLLQKLAAMLGKRMLTWTKLLNMNIALEALSDQIALQRVK